MNELSVDLDRHFALGRDVSITTLHDEQISGIILAFDKKTTMIVIQCASRVLCLNIRNVKSISTSEDIENDFPAEFHKKSLSVAKLRDRLEGAIENKKSLAQDTANHSPTGQKLIESLNRTLRCKWQGSSIVVIDSRVQLNPPYRACDVEILSGGTEQGRDHVAKVINHFYENNP